MNITLYHYDFESDNQNVLLFEDKTARDNYFASINESDKQTIQNINFFANNLLQTKVFVRVAGLSLFNILNYNYAIVTNSTGETAQKPLFYYITESRQDSGGQIEINLKCDIANTYFYDVDMTKWQAIIERANLDRWLKLNEQGTSLTYNFRNTSALFERERLKDVAKRPTIKKQLYFKIDSTANSKLNEWLRDNIAGWKYYYLAGNVTYNRVFKYHNNQITSDQPAELSYVTEPRSYYNQGTNSNFIVLCCPVYKNASVDSNYIRKNFIYINYDSSTNTILDEDTIVTYFLQNNNQYANVLSIKYSTLTPFKTSAYNYGTDYTIDSDNNLIIYRTDNFDNSESLIYETSSYSNPTMTSQLRPFYAVHKQYLYENKKLICDFDDNAWTFTPAQIKGNNAKEPKLYNEDYSVYRLFIGGQQHYLPISKTSPKPAFEYSEILSPDITKAIVIYDNANSDYGTLANPVFANITKQDFTGFNFTIDLSIWYPSNNLQNYLAENKNYLQIFNNQQLQKNIPALIGATSGIISGYATGNYTGASQGAGITATSSKSIINSYYDRQNLDMTIDNMANSPESLQNINSNPLFITAVQKSLDIFIEKMEMLDFEQDIIVDYFKQFGYTYNRIDTIDNHMRTRKYYNYIQAQIFEIPEKLGNNIKEEIKKMFANGIRFWHYDTYTGVNFSQNNYERYLDE